MKNVLTKFKVRVNKELTGDQICEALIQSLVNVDNVYSYILYADYDKDGLQGFSVEFLVSQTESYNTIKQEDIVADAAAKMLKHIKSEQQRYVIGYKQPPLDKLLELYEPLVQSLAAKQQEYWQHLEYEDLCQMCRLCICTLYKAGYYIHRQLVQRAFSNDVLMSIRKEKFHDKPLSLNRNVRYDDEKVELMDLIPDTSMTQELEQQYDDEDDLRILKEKRDLIIEEVGQRQYDQLVKAYAFGNTDAMSRSTVNRLKRKFAQLGITENTFQRYF